MYDLKDDWNFFMSKEGELSLSVINKTEYQKQQTMEDKTLSERIVEVLESCHEDVYNWNGEDEVSSDYFNDEEAAKELEKLFLQEKLNLLEEIFKEYYSNDFSLRTLLDKKRIEYQQQLNSIK